MANKEVAPSSEMRIWYELNNKHASVMIAADAVVDDLRAAIIKKNPSLKEVDPGTIDIYKAVVADAVEGRAQRLIPVNESVSTLGETSIVNPIIVIASAPPPQQQQWGVPLAFQPVIEFAKQQMDKHTEGRAFSKAGYTWARLLLSERGIQVRTKELNLDGGQGSEPEGFHWTVETKDNEVVRPGENYKTKGAMDWVLQNFLRSDDIFGLKVVTGSALPELRGHTKKANGKSDLVIGKKAELQIATATDPYDFAFGLIELKQDIYYINKGQNVLELASLATISRVGKNSSLLATDCNTQWELYWFEDERTIVRGVYRSGRKCFEDFRRLLMDAESRVLRPPSRQTRLVLPNFEEHGDEEVDPDDEQNLDGFGADDPKTKALERQGQLDALADYLGDLYGVRPNVPSWAMAKNTCPDYYA